jgi:hypothetical protein
LNGLALKAARESLLDQTEALKIEADELCVSLGPELLSYLEKYRSG